MLSVEFGGRFARDDEEYRFGHYCSKCSLKTHNCSNSVNFITNSTVIQAALNSGRSRSKDLKRLLRRLFWVWVKNNFLGTRDNTVMVKELDKGGYMCCNDIFQGTFPSSIAGDKLRSEQ